MVIGFGPAATRWLLLCLPFAAGTSRVQLRHPCLHGAVEPVSRLPYDPGPMGTRPRGHVAVVAHHQSGGMLENHSPNKMRRSQSQTNT